MSDSDNTNPRTRHMHMDWRLRNLRRRSSTDIHSVAREQGTRVATVVAVNEAGDVQIDRMTDANGDGEWLTPLNNRYPTVGQVVTVTDVEGKLAVSGPIGQGSYRILPDEVFSEPDDFNPQTNPPGPGIDNSGVRNVPFFGVDPTNPESYFGAPPFFTPNHWHWNDHFTTGAASLGDAGKESWDIGGSGSASYPGTAFSQHCIRLATSATSGAAMSLALSTPYDRLTIESGVGYTEFWFSAMLEVTANVIFRAGLMNPLRAGGSGEPANGVYWRSSSNNANWEAVIRSGGSDVLVHTTDYAMQSSVIGRIRIEPLLAYGQSRVTFVLYGSDQENGQAIAPLSTLSSRVVDLASSSLPKSQPGFTINALSNVSKSVLIDWAGGWRWTNNFLWGGAA